MASATTLNLKLVECCATTVPRAQFAAISKPSCSSLSVKQIRFSPNSISLNSRNLPLRIVPFVAQTSDWAQDEEAVVAEGDEEIGDSEENSEEGEIEESFSEPPEEAKLFVGNLPYDVDSAKLAGLFNEAGVVEICEVIYNRQTDQSRGFGFVTMSTVEEAEKAIELFSGYDINGRVLTVNKASPRGTQPERAPRVQSFGPSFRIYVGNLPWRVDDARLVEVFSEHGKVVDARVIFDQESGRSRGFGFVTMSTETEVNDAIAALDGQELDGRAIRVNVAEERPRRAF